MEDSSMEEIYCEEDSLHTKVDLMTAQELQGKGESASAEELIPGDQGC